MILHSFSEYIQINLISNIVIVATEGAGNNLLYIRRNWYQFREHLDFFMLPPSERTYQPSWNSRDESSTTG